MNTEQKIAKVAAILHFVAVILPNGIKMIIGAAKEPTVKDYAMIIDTLQPSGSGPFEPRPKNSSPNQEALDLLCKTEDICDHIGECGGWPEITRVAKEFRREQPLMWRVFEDVSECKQTLAAQCVYGVPVYIADKHGIDQQTASRYRSEVPRIIAERSVRKTEMMF